MIFYHWCVDDFFHIIGGLGFLFSHWCVDDFFHIIGGLVELFPTGVLMTSFI